MISYHNIMIPKKDDARNPYKVHPHVQKFADKCSEITSGPNNKLGKFYLSTYSYCSPPPLLHRYTYLTCYAL